MKHKIRLFLVGVLIVLTIGNTNLASAALKQYVYVSKWGSYGSSDGKFYCPTGIATDSNGNVYIADHFNHRIQKFSKYGTYLGKWGSAGTGNGQFNCPTGIAIDDADNVYVADMINYRIQVFETDGDYVSQWAIPSSPMHLATYSTGLGVRVYVASADYKVRKYYGTSRTLCATWGGYGGGNGKFKGIGGLVVGSSEIIYVTDRGNHRVQKFNKYGTYLGKWGSYGTGNGQFRYPEGIDIYGDEVFVAESGNNRIQVFTTSGSYKIKFGSFGSGNGQFSYACAINLWTKSFIFISDIILHRIQRWKEEVYVPPPPFP
jgi:DNA-binding beta-propeller fold protein YncE